MEPTLVILAAGMGNRFGGPKQIEKIDERGHTLLDYSLYDAVSVGFRRAVFIIRKETKELFASLIKSRRWRNYMQVDFAFQELTIDTDEFKDRKKPWGTAHAIACLGEMVNSPFAVINADDFYGREAIGSVFSSIKQGEYCMAAYKLKNTLSKNGAVSRGICKISNGYLSEITEKSGIEAKDGMILDREGSVFAPDTPVSMNLWGLMPEIIGECKNRFPSFLAKEFTKNPQGCEFYLPEVIKELVFEGKVRLRVINAKEKWYGITYKNDKSEVVLALENMVDEGVYPREL